MGLPCPCPFAGGVAGFLGQFTLRTGEYVFASVKFAGRKLDHHAAHRVTKLALQHHTQVARCVFQQGNHHHRARMHHKLAGAGAAVRKRHRVAHHTQEVPLKQRLA